MSTLANNLHEDRRGKVLIQDLTKKQKKSGEKAMGIRLEWQMINPSRKNSFFFYNFSTALRR